MPHKRKPFWAPASKLKKPKKPPTPQPKSKKGPAKLFNPLEWFGK